MKVKSYVIRAAGFRDAEGIFRLIKQYPAELLPRPISDIVQNIDRFFVCEMEGRVVGTAAWQILPEIGAGSAPTVEIKSVAVAKPLRKKGIGQALVRGVIERIKAIQPWQIIVLTFSPEFFGKLGFKEVPKKTLMHKIYMGCINCAKYDSPFTCPEKAMALTFAKGPNGNR